MREKQGVLAVDPIGNKDYICQRHRRDLCPSSCPHARHHRPFGNPHSCAKLAGLCWWLDDNEISLCVAVP